MNTFSETDTIRRIVILEIASSCGKRERERWTEDSNGNPEMMMRIWTLFREIQFSFPKFMVYSCSSHDGKKEEMIIGRGRER